MSLSIFNFSKYPKSFLLALIIILSFEATNVFFGRYFRSPESTSGYIVQIKNKLSKNSENRFDVLILGDCFNHTGIMPRVIDNMTGLSCYNFSAYFEQTIMSQYCILKNYLNTAQTKPKFIIIGFKRISLSRNREQIMKSEIHYFYDFKEGNINIFLEEFGFGETVKFFVPSLKHQSFFKKFIKNLFLAKISSKDAKKGEDVKKIIYIEKGFTEVKRVYKGNTKEIGGVYKRFLATPFFCKYLKYILDLAKKNNIQVIYIIPANPPDVFKIAKKNSVVKEYKDFILSFQQEYPNLTLIYPQDILNKKELYASRDHLNGEGSLILSKAVANKITKLNKKSESILHAR